MSKKIADKEVADKLAKLRDSKGLTVFEVAAAIECNPSDLKGMEEGNLPVPVKLINSIANYYGVEVIELFGETQMVPAELKELGVEGISFTDEVKDREMTPEKIAKYKEIVKKIKAENNSNDK